jgi:hypothetical protein
MTRELNEMERNRKGLALGAAALGAAGALALGVGVARAEIGTPSPSPSPSPSASICDHTGAMGAWAAGQNSPITAAATYLGLSQTDLRAQMRAGKSLADVAKAQNKPVTGLVDAMVAAAKTNLDANTTLTADQKTAALAQARTRIEAMVNTTHSPGTGMGGGRHGGMRGGMWR